MSRGRIRSTGLGAFCARAPLTALAVGLTSLTALEGARAEASSGAREVAAPGYLAPGSALRSQSFWWPGVVFERASTHLTGRRSIDETRLGVALAYRSPHLSPHLRALLSPSLGGYQNFAGLAGAGVRVHFEVAGVPLSYGVGLSLEARLRDSFWLAYATPLELGMPLYRGGSAEHHLFLGARRSMAGSLINSYLLDPNGYNNEQSLEELAVLREDHPWQIYISFVFGRRVE